MYKLRYETDRRWAEYIADHFDRFLVDHAASERKAQAAAMHFVVRYSDKHELVDSLVQIAIDELNHFRDVFEIMRQRGIELGDDIKDPYANRLLTEARSSGRARLMDRLLVASISEYRGCERFALLSEVLESRNEAELADFYRDLAAADSRHRKVYFELAQMYFDADDVRERLDVFLDEEARVLESLPRRPALH